MRLSNELKRKLILSVGTHRGNRPLSPIEVAEGFEVARTEGMSTKEIARMVCLEGSTMIGRFMRLLQLSPEIRHIVDWRSSESTISFSAASEIVRLDLADQEIVIKAALENRITKTEIIEIVQIKQATDKEITLCIEDVLRRRPQIIKQFVFIGSICSKELSSVLTELTQIQRDNIFSEVLLSKLKLGTKWYGRLGKTRFSIVGGEMLSDQLKELEPDFEESINAWLLQKTRN